MAGLAHGHADGFLNHIKDRRDVELVGIAEPDKAIFDRYGAKFQLDPKLYHADLDELLTATKPQAVLVYTNTYDHVRAVEICAKHKIPVMMEKPLAISIADAHAIQRAAKSANIPVLVNYETTWYRSNRAAYDLVHENKIGPVRKVVVHDGHSGPAKINVQPEFFAWLNDAKLNGAGALYDFGCYGADLMTWLMDGRRPDSVTAITQHFQPNTYKVDDEGTILVTYPKAIAILQASWNWPFDRKDMEVYGATGEAITVKKDDVRVRLEGEEQEHIEHAPPLRAPESDAVSYLIAVLRGKVKGSGLSDLETNVKVVRILDAARESARTGRAVRLAR